MGGALFGKGLRGLRRYVNAIRGDRDDVRSYRNKVVDEMMAVQEFSILVWALIAKRCPRLLKKVVLVIASVIAIANIILMIVIALVCATVMSFRYFIRDAIAWRSIREAFSVMMVEWLNLWLLYMMVPVSEIVRSLFMVWCSAQKKPADEVLNAAFKAWF